MSGKLPRSARGGCHTKRISMVADAHVKEKVEMCADKMPPGAWNKGRMHTCQDLKNNNWRKNRFFAAAQNDREDN